MSTTTRSETRSFFRFFAARRGTILIGVAVGVVVAASIRQDYEQVLSSAFQVLDNQALIAEAKVGAVLRGMDVGLRGLASDQETEPRLPERAISQHQRAFLREFPEVRTITATDNSGQVIAAESHQTPEDLEVIRAFNISQRDYFRFHQGAGRADFDRMYLSRPFIGSSKKLIIVASRAIRGENGAFRGVVVATLIPRFFEPILQDVLANTLVDAAAVHNRQADVLYRLPDAEKHTGKNISKSDAFQKYLQSETNITHHVGMTVTDGLKRLIVFDQIGTTGIDIAISARYDVIIRQWYSTVAWKILLYSLFIVAMLALRRQWLRRQQAAMDLSDSEVRFRNLFDLAPIALAISNREGQILLMNREFEQLFGYRREDVPTVQAFQQRIYPDTVLREQQEKAYWDNWRGTPNAGHAAMPAEQSVRCKDGSHKTILLSRQRLGDDMLAAFIDITARKAAEERVRELSQAIEQSPEATVITDLEARIQYVNDAFVATSGYSREELLGQNPRLLQSGRTAKENYAALWANLIQGRVWSGELINRRKDGTEYTEFAIISPMRDNSGRITHYVAVKQDISERKRLNAELDQHRYHLQELVDERTQELDVAKTRAEAANVAKSAFLANMSHEIRTPMNGVLGMAHLLRRSGVNAKQAVYLDKIEASGNHLIAVINNILDISKIEAGKLQLGVADFRLCDLIRDVTDIVGHSASDKGLELVTDIADAPQDVRGDRGRLCQALVNYVSNAIKFTEHGCITLRCHTLETGKADYLLRFEVADTGVGIRERDLERLFQSFEQADNSITRKYGGTGLGLVITKHIAELMGGAAGAESEPGKGSTFWLTVRLGRGSAPTGDEIAVVEDHRRAIQTGHGGRRILIVEDNDVNREVAAMLMDDVGLVADHACNGLEAIEKAKQGSYALILMDVQMPELDGVEATRCIRQLRNCEHLPILAMTANVFDEDRELCLAAGMNDFIKKPFEPEQFLATVLRWLSNGGG